MAPGKVYQLNFIEYDYNESGKAAMHSCMISIFVNLLVPLKCACEMSISIKCISADRYFTFLTV